MTEQTIPGLPAHLAVVPPGPTSPDDPDRAKKRLDWRAWREAVVADNAEWRKLLAKHKELREVEVELCAQDPAYFLARWGTIYEPRPGKRRLPGFQPFVPSAKQVQIIREFQASLADDETPDADIVLSKCRGVGASNLFVDIACWGWLFVQPWNVLFMSRKEELVDARNPRSLFWKLDKNLQHLKQNGGAFLLPKGFDPMKRQPEWRQDKLLIHPETGVSIGGESTTTAAARSDRLTWTFFDEFALMPGGATIWATAAESTDHRIAASTETFEVSMDFWNLQQPDEDDIKPKVLTFDWWELAFNDDEWFAHQKRRYAKRLQVFNAEILRNPWEGQVSWVYPEARTIMPDRQVKRIPGAPLYVAIDPGRADDSAYIWIQEHPEGFVDILRVYINRKKIADFYVPILTGKPDPLEHYTPEERDLMAWVAQQPTPSFVGDNYGFNEMGATADTFYSRFALGGIHVRRDRLPDGRISQYRREARTHVGRQQALREILPRVRVAPEAVYALDALKQYRWRESDKPMMSEARVPLHDWASHPVTALEFYAVAKWLDRKLFDWKQSKPTKAGHNRHRFSQRPSVRTNRYNDNALPGGPF